MNYRLGISSRPSRLDGIFTPYCHPYDKAIVLQSVKADIDNYCTRHKTDFVQDDAVMKILDVPNYATLRVFKLQGLPVTISMLSGTAPRRCVINQKSFARWATPLIKAGLATPPPETKRHVAPNHSYSFNI